MRKHPFVFSNNEANAVRYNKPMLKRILPHREPFLLIDHITRLSLEDQMLEAKREIQESDRILQGHFPGQPVYPGVLQIEMMGQAGLCLAHFVSLNTTIISEGAVPKKGWFTKIHHAQFLHSILPNERVSVIAKLEEYDEWIGVVSCQILKQYRICSLGVLEVYFDE